MVPFPVINLFVDRSCFGGARAHVQQQVQMSVQHLDGKEVHFKGDGALCLLGLLFWPSVAEQKKPVRFSSAEVKGYGASLLSIPFM